MRTFSVFLPAVTATFFLTARASAQLSTETMTDRWAKCQRTRFGLEVDMLSTSEGASLSADGLKASVLETSFTVIGQIGPIGGFHLDVEVPFAYVSTKAPAAQDGATPIAVQGFVLGNLTLGAHYADTVASPLTLFGGISVSLPFASDSNLASEYAAEYASAARGFFDSHRLIVDRVPLRARVGAEVRLVKIVFVRGDLGGMLAMAMNADTSDILVEQSDEVEVRAEIGLGGGLRFQAALPLDASDIVQAAVEPFVAYEPPEAGVFARLGFLVALDKPLGFGFDTGKVATIRLTLGGKF